MVVDYDGMFVPAMRGQKARELGSVDYLYPFQLVFSNVGKVNTSFLDSLPIN